MRQKLSLPRRKRRSFTPEYEAEAVRLVQVGDHCVREVAKALGLTATALREWTKRTAIDGGKGPPGTLTTAPRPVRRPPSSSLVGTNCSASPSDGVLAWIIHEGAGLKIGLAPTRRVSRWACRSAFEVHVAHRIG